MSYRSMLQTEMKRHMFKEHRQDIITVVGEIKNKQTHLSVVQAGQPVEEPANREQAARDQMASVQEARVQLAMEQAAREKAARDQGVRDQEARQQALQIVNSPVRRTRDRPGGQLFLI